ncbi:MAG: hemerythrin domain-containing protein [Bacteroidota bacterium]
MKPTDQLKQEHKAVKLMLEILEKMCHKLESGEEKINLSHLDQTIEFIKVFVDKCHHAKEEELLFPAMEAAGIPREGGPIGMMLMEHDIGRNYVKNLSEAVDKYKAGDNRASAGIVENARKYAELLAQHIVKEDSILYPMAEATLPEEGQEKLLEEFERVENERVGAGKHEEFHKMLSTLRDIYLS